jgi:hypothetical protein
MLDLYCGMLIKSTSYHPVHLCLQVSIRFVESRMTGYPGSNIETAAHNLMAAKWPDLPDGRVVRRVIGANVYVTWHNVFRTY